MAVNRGIAFDTITSLVDNPIENSDSLVGDTTEVASIAAVQSESANTIVTTDSGSSNGGAGWIGVVLSLAVGYYAWKMAKNLRKEISDLKKRLSCKDEELARLSEQIETLGFEIKSVKQTVHSIPTRPSIQVVEPTVTQHTHTHYQKEEASYQKEKAKPAKRQTILRYATLQSPDGNDILRFSERSMADSPSAQKMFVLEIDNESGTGTYRVNPKAMDLIMADLQMFRDFVKPFTFSGNPSNASIQDKVPGKIVRKGNFWVVDEPLEISIH